MILACPSSRRRPGTLWHVARELGVVIHHQHIGGAGGAKAHFCRRLDWNLEGQGYKKIVPTVNWKGWPKHQINLKEVNSFLENEPNIVWFWWTRMDENRNHFEWLTESVIHLMTDENWPQIQGAALYSESESNGCTLPLSILNYNNLLGFIDIGCSF